MIRISKVRLFRFGILAAIALAAVVVLVAAVAPLKAASSAICLVLTGEPPTLVPTKCAPPPDCKTDGRVNTNCSAPEVLYCTDGMMNFYKIVDGEGVFDFSYDPKNLPASVETNTLLVQHGAVSLYMLPDGSLEMTAPQTDGKTYFMVFNPSSCTSQYESAQ